MKRLFRSARQALGFSWSFLIYYGLPFHHYALRRIYTPLIKPGDLCFDIGAHLGDRLHTWSKLGARVVALKPHPDMMTWLRRWYGHHPNIVLVKKAVSAQPGRETLWINHLTPSVSTISQKWLTRIQQNRRFAGARWEEQIPVTVTTLDQLIRQYGSPTFCKIDVEGAELDVLQGLSQAIPRFPLNIFQPRSRQRLAVSTGWINWAVTNTTGG